MCFCGPSWIGRGDGHGTVFGHKDWVEGRIGRVGEEGEVDLLDCAVFKAGVEGARCRVERYAERGERENESSQDGAGEWVPYLDNKGQQVCLGLSLKTM